MTTWTDADMTDQSGRVALVTGATSGLGLRTATVLAANGARVLLGYRDRERAEVALARVAVTASGAAPELVRLDLADLRSVAEAAKEVRERTGDRLDLLVNNAGIMAPPLKLSVDRFESQWATNVIGPAALTWQLLPAIVDVPRSRVVTVTSIAHYAGGFDPSSIVGEWHGLGYHPVRVYAHTKLADLAFARELQRRLVAGGSRALSVAAHPGMAESNIAATTLQRAPAAVQRFGLVAYNTPAQPTEHGAWPILFAATFPGVRGGYLIAPRGPFQVRGRPTAVPGSGPSRDEAFGARLWELLEHASGVTSPV
jgi:NAD(P)-dependent dehydrogenase (short-subunit alcohol dehydrogenase family)